MPDEAHGPSLTAEPLGVMDVIDRVPGLAGRAGHVRQLMADRRLAARAHTRLEGEDAPEIRNWTWPHA
ncbi:MAG TPA: hypothetical protein VKY90_21025 [Candidatus Dormibacteraeota bacterium]|nr:hypothetical protein [Candidatus Dormibacteraeota bacterium]